MKKVWKKAAALTLAGVMTAGMLSGCGEKTEKLDGTKTVATINGEDVSLGLLSFVVRNQQAYIKAMYEAYGLTQYTSSLWDSPASDESEQTYGELTREQSLESLEMMVVLRSKAAEYGVELSDEDNQKIKDAATAFIAANSEETIAALGVTEEIMAEYLALQTIGTRMHDPIIAEVDREVSDEQAQMSSFSYVHITTNPEATEEELAQAEENAKAVQEALAAALTVEEEEEAKADDKKDADKKTADKKDADKEEDKDAADDEDADKEDKKAADDKDADKKEDKKTADSKTTVKEDEEVEAEEAETEDAEEELTPVEKEEEELDLNAIVKEIDDSLYIAKGTFQTNLSDDWDDDTSSYLNAQLVETVRGMKEGEVSEVITTEEDGYFIAIMNKEFDEDATETERKAIVTARENEAYTETTQGWLDAAEITVNEEVLATLTVTDAQVFIVESHMSDTITEEEGAEVVTEVEDLTTEDEDLQPIDEPTGEEEIIEEEDEQK